MEINAYTVFMSLKKKNTLFVPECAVAGVISTRTSFTHDKVSSGTVGRDQDMTDARGSKDENRVLDKTRYSSTKKKKKIFSGLPTRTYVEIDVCFKLTWSKGDGCATGPERRSLREPTHVADS